MIDFIKQTLLVHYNLPVSLVNEIQGGWSATAFRAISGNAHYFVKVYDKHRPSVRPWIDRVDAYMPAVLWLSANTALGQWMNAPLLTADKAYKVETDAYLLMVFPFIDGETLCENPLSAQQIRQLANILATLHAVRGPLPFPTDALREDFSVPFAASLEAILGMDTLPQSLAAILSPHQALLRQATGRLLCLADSLRASPPPFVLCHTDVHGWNLMWADKLLLIDWEGLRLAPPEADLFTITDGFFFDYAREAFMAAYKEKRNGYAENESVMAFYRLRRRLEDIEAFAQSILYDPLTQEEYALSLHHLEKECTALLKNNA